MVKTTIQNVILALKEFVEVWLHQILYHNAVYPAEVFDRVRLFDVIVYRSRSPPLNEYVSTLVNDFLKLLVNEGGQGVNQLVVAVYDTQSQRTRKRYVVNFPEFLNVGAKITTWDFLSATAPPGAGAADDGTPVTVPGFTWNEVYGQLRSLLHLHVRELGDTTDERECSFRVFVNMEEPPLVDPAWVPVLAAAPKKVRFVPIGEVSVGWLCLDMHNEY